MASNYFLKHRESTYVFVCLGACCVISKPCYNGAMFNAQMKRKELQT